MPVISSVSSCSAGGLIAEGWWDGQQEAGGASEGGGADEACARTTGTLSTLYNEVGKTSLASLSTGSFKNDLCDINLYVA